MTGRVRFESVTRRFGDVVALDDVDLTIEPGRFHCLVGPNGSGKTTLLSLLLGLRSPTGGAVHRDGATVGVSFQTPTFYPDLTVAENLATFERMYDGVDDDWRASLEETLRLEEVAGRRTGALSGGWQKKLDLALALLARPSHVVLDEPLDDLDDLTKRRLRALLADYADADRAVFVATHHVRDFEDHVDYLTVLDRGRVRFDGPIEDGQSARERYLELIDG